MSQKLCNQCGTVFYIEPNEGWKKICLKCWKKNKKSEEENIFNNRYTPPPKTGFIPDEMLRRLIFLCHPDKHDSSEASNKATQWLLKQKRSQL